MGTLRDILVTLFIKNIDIEIFTVNNYRTVGRIKSVDDYCVEVQGENEIHIIVIKKIVRIIYKESAESVSTQR